MRQATLKKNQVYHKKTKNQMRTPKWKENFLVADYCDLTLSPDTGSATTCFCDNLLDSKVVVVRVHGIEKDVHGLIIEHKVGRAKAGVGLLDRD